MRKDKAKIMVIEDENLLLQAIVKKLKTKGFETVSCVSGEQAVDYLNTMTDLPDAIWLDYYLKDMNGLDFMKKLKENQNWSKIPVVVVSNSASPSKVDSMVALGAKKYMLKAENRLDDIVETFDKIIEEV